MANTFEQTRPELDLSTIVVAKPVGSREWKAASFLSNFINGKGTCLVPTTAPNQLHDDASLIYRFRVIPRKTAIQRIWIITFNCSEGVSIQLKAPAASGVLAEVAIPEGRSSTPVYYIENLTEKSNEDQEISIQIAPPEAKTVTVETISCWEFDRAILNSDTTDNGVDNQTLAPNGPIFNAQNTSVGGVIRSMQQMDFRRPSLLQFSYPELYPTGSIFSLGVPVLAEKLNRTDTKGAVLWRVYGNTTLANSGSVRLTSSHSGVNDVIPILSTTSSWSNPKVVWVDCEDVATSNGLQDGQWDDVNAYVSGSARLGSLSIYTPLKNSILDLSSGTFTRARAAFAEVSAVSASLWSTNQLRYEDKGDLAGLMPLIEMQTFTNQFTNSNLTSSTWSTVNCSLTSNSVTGSDGTVTAGTAIFAASALAFAYQSPSTNNSELWRISFWAKMASGTGNVRAFIRQRDGATVVSSSDFALDTNWKRVQAVLSVGTGASAVRMGIQNGSDGTSRAVQIWGLQAILETNTTARGNSYIATSGTAVSSSPDSLSFSGGMYPDSFRTRGFSFFHAPFRSSAEMYNAQSSFLTILFGFSDDADNYVSLRGNSGVTKLYVQISGAIVLTSSAIGFMRDEPIGFEILPSQGEIRIVASSGTVTSTGTPWEFPSGTFYIGGRLPASPFASGGRYSKYWIGA